MDAVMVVFLAVMGIAALTLGGMLAARKRHEYAQERESVALIKERLAVIARQRQDYFND